MAKKVIRRKKTFSGKSKKFGAAVGRREQRHSRDNFPPALGIVQIEKTPRGIRYNVQPTSRGPGAVLPLMVDLQKHALADGMLIRYRRKGGQAQILEIVAPSLASGALHRIAAEEHNLPTDFSAATLEECADMVVPAPGKYRKDIRDLPLVTIDGETAKDFDDAVHARPDPSSKNPGGWIITVAIADVSHYVHPGSALDEDAFKRGNSVYFPDAVIPMLPETLSNNLCSLRPHEDRACLAVEMVISDDGHLKRYTFFRGLMRSVARLTYTYVQNLLDSSELQKKDAVLYDTIVHPLHKAYKVLAKARAHRGSLEISSKEHEFFFDEVGDLSHVTYRQSVTAHNLIEELMILANVAAATALEKAGKGCMYRVHDHPEATRLMALYSFLQNTIFKMPRILKPTPHDFNALSAKSKSSPYAQVIQDWIMRTQSQAYYSPNNIGHFGLGLERYAHFTSPIRRYADVLVHRALVALCDLGDGGFDLDLYPDLSELGIQISRLERRAVEAERETISRYLALYHQVNMGKVVPGVISGMNKAGFYVRLMPDPGEGFIPVRTLTDDFYTFDEISQMWFGRRTRKVFRLGDPIQVRITEANPLSGKITLAHVGQQEPRSKESRPRPPRKAHKGRRG